MSEQNYQAPPTSPASYRVSGSEEESMLLSGGMKEKTEEVRNHEQQENILTHASFHIIEGSKNTHFQAETVQPTANASPLKQEATCIERNSPLLSQVGGQSPLVKNQTISQSKQYQNHYNSTQQLNKVLQERRKTLYKALRNTFKESESPNKSSNPENAPHAPEVMNQEQKIASEQCEQLQPQQQSEPFSLSNTKQSMSMVVESSQRPEDLSMVVNTSFDKRPNIDPTQKAQSQAGQLLIQKEDDIRTITNVPQPMDIESHVKYAIIQNEGDNRSCEIRVQTVLAPAKNELCEGNNEQKLPSGSHISQTKPVNQQDFVEEFGSRQTVKQLEEQPQGEQIQVDVSLPDECSQNEQIVLQKQIPQGQPVDVEHHNYREESQYDNEPPHQRQTSSKLENIQNHQPVQASVEEELAKNQKTLKAEYSLQQDQNQRPKFNCYSSTRLQQTYAQSPNYTRPYERQKSIHNSPMILIEQQQPNRANEVLIEENQQKDNIQISPKKESSPHLSNVFVQNSYNLHDKPMNPMESLSEMRQNVPVPSYPPCISISINRFNEIALNIFNNNPNTATTMQTEKEVIKQQGQQGISQQDEPIHQEFSAELCCLRNESSNQKIMKNEPLEKEKKNRTIEISSSSESHHSDTPVFNVSTENRQVQTSRVVELDSSDQISKEPLRQTYDRIYKASDTYLSITNYQPCDHKYFEEIIRPHVCLRISAYPQTEIGQMLFKDGLFLTALAKFTIHSNASPFLANYIFEYLQSTSQIQRNQFIFQKAYEQARDDFEKHLEEKYMQKYSKIRQQHEEVEQNLRPAARRTLQEIQNPEPKEISQRKARETKIQNLSLRSNFFSLSEQISKPPEKQSKPLQEHLSYLIPAVEKEKSASANTSADSSEVRQAKKNFSADSIHDDHYHKKDKYKRDKPTEKDHIGSTEKTYKFDVVDTGKIHSKVKEEHTDSIKKETAENPSKTSLRESTSSERGQGDQRFRELYEKYLNHRKSSQNPETKPVSKDKSEPLSGILKSKERSLEKGSSGDAEGKKKKNVQFVEQPVMQQSQESEQEQYRLKKGGKKTKGHADSLEHDRPRRKKETSRKHKK